MSDECIHGLPGTQCAICFPEKPAETPPAARPARPTAPRANASRPARSRLERPAPRTGNLATARLFHVTHAANLPAIVASGALLPAAECGEARVFDASSAANRAARAAVTLGGRPLAEHVPFYLTPNANLWQGILAGTDDPRISDSARDSAGSDFVMLVVPLADALALAAGAGTELPSSDGDAAAPLTRFAETTDATRRLIARALAEEEPEIVLRAEVLVPVPVPLRCVAVIGVPNTTARAAVRRELAGSSVRVSVYPPWFQPLQA